MTLAADVETAPVVGIDLPVEGRSADLEDLGGTHAVAPGLAKCLTDLFELDGLEPGEVAPGDRAALRLAEVIDAQDAWLLRRGGREQHAA